MQLPDFTILGNPVIKKNSRPIYRRKDGTPMLGKSVNLRMSEESGLWQLRDQMRDITEPLPITYPMHIKCLFYNADKRRRDLSNLLEMPADLLQKAGIIENDCLIESWDGSRKYVDTVNPRIEIYIERFH